MAGSHCRCSVNMARTSAAFSAAGAGLVIKDLSCASLRGADCCAPGTPASTDISPNWAPRAICSPDLTGHYEHFCGSTNQHVEAVSTPVTLVHDCFAGS